MSSKLIFITGKTWDNDWLNIYFDWHAMSRPILSTAGLTGSVPRCQREVHEPKGQLILIKKYLYRT